MDALAASQAATRNLPLPPPPEDIKSDMEKQVEKLATTHPETVTEVVQSWLRED
jgi:flagellar biosynthesis/type III secretory pathway M-ring protein FliF/YscJ